MDKDKDKIEDMFKESFDDFEPEVEPKVWKNVKTALKWGGAGLFVKLLINKIGTNTLVAIISSAITVISTIWMMDWKKPSEKTNSETNKSEITNVIVAEKPHESSGINNSKSSNPSVVEEKKDTEKNIEKTASETKVPEKSFKNTSLIEVSKDEERKIKSVIKDLSKKSVANISANPVSGSVPLVVNLVNIGVGTENKWTFSDGQKSSNDPNPPCVFLTPGIHTIILHSKSADGKIGIDSAHVTVIGNSSMSGFPNVFSPNDDGLADVFTFQSKNMTEIKAEIFDKNSKLIYKWVGIDGKWDGRTLKGDRAPEGEYYYIVSAEGIDGKKYEQKGVIKLAR